jgi:hypothetical protein
MPIQILNAEHTTLLSTQFAMKNEPNYAWGNALSGYLLSPRLRGQWGVSTDDVFSVYDHSGQGRTMTGLGAASTPLAYQYGMSPYHNFIRASSQYYQRPDEAGIDILEDLTMWTWIRFHAASTGALVYFYSKWLTAGGQQAYLLSKTAANALTFSISNSGADAFSVTDAAANYLVDTWFFIAGRFTPSTEVKLWVGNALTGALTPYTNIVAIPATIFNSDEPLEVGRGNQTNYLDGYMSLWGLAAWAMSDTDIFTKFHQARPLFMW